MRLRGHEIKLHTALGLECDIDNISISSETVAFLHRCRDRIDSLMGPWRWRGGPHRLSPAPGPPPASRTAPPPPPPGSYLGAPPPRPRPPEREQRSSRDL